MFPPEIFAEIFGFLGSEARVLLACSQAHPTFAQLIEPTLYTHVIIYNRSDADSEDGHHLKLKPYQLSTLLSDNPRIRNYLHSLCVDFFWLFSDVVATKEMSAILPRLKLERIQLTFGHADFCIEWEQCSNAFRTAFVACISTSFMKEVCLDGVCRVPLSSFADCVGLKRLMLRYSALPPSDSSFKFPHLEALELFDWTVVDYSQDFFSWVLTHACGLRSLTLTTSTTSVLRGFLPRLLAIFSTSLVNLTIYHAKSTPLRYDATPVEIDLPGLPSLERLRLCTYTGSSESTVSDSYLVNHVLSEITQILRNFSSLKHLTLIICLRFRGRDITQVDWSPLADFLSDRYSSFQHTDLYIRAVKAGSEVSSDEVISMLSHYEDLMSLVEAGYLSIMEEKYLDVHVNRYFKYYT